MNIKLNHSVVLTIGIICSFSLQASQKGASSNLNRDFKR